jgi:hypothetical protein
LQHPALSDGRAAIMLKLADAPLDGRLNKTPPGTWPTQVRVRAFSGFGGFIGRFSFRCDPCS